ncbi:MAG: hypothetical protein RIK87_11015 [Fuerstiella sp.]
MVTRRSFLQGLSGSAIMVTPGILSPFSRAADSGTPAPAIPRPLPQKDVFRFIRRLRGTHDPVLYAQILGAANEFQEDGHLTPFLQRLRSGPLPNRDERFHR